MRKTIYIIVIFLLIGFFGYLVSKNIKSSLSTDLPSVTIRNKVIKVVISDTIRKQMQGLSNKKNLCADCGMLFVFSTSRVQSFWMKNMNFPLDIIWIADDKIINISKNLPPEGESPSQTYSSIFPANHVLEVNSGYADKTGIKIGDTVKYNY